MDVERLCDFLRGGNVVCVTGAGISTESGIPDYRGANGSYNKGHVPMQHMEFLKEEEKRKRYWARSLVGYRYFFSRKPNSAHLDLAALESVGLIRGVITQNVDLLHTQAGSSNVIDLHGTNDKVACQSCGATRQRIEFQEEVEARNHGWIEAFLLQQVGPDGRSSESQPVDIRSDGDAHLRHDDFRDFEVPSPPMCMWFPLLRWASMWPRLGGCLPPRCLPSRGYFPSTIGRLPPLPCARPLIHVRQSACAYAKT